MTRKASSVRSLLASTVPNAPYAPRPERYELIAAIERAVTSPGVQLAELAALLRREEAGRAWLERRDALRSCVLSHDLKATPQGQRMLKACRCATCAKWREELRALNEAKKAANP